MPAVPAGLRAAVPDTPDVADIVELLAAHQRAAHGSSSVDPQMVASNVAGPGSWTRRQALVRDDAGTAIAWVVVHDRAAGRTVVEITALPSVTDELAASLFHWAEGVARSIMRARGLASTQLDSGAYADDDRGQRWLAAAGFRHTR